MNFFGVMQIKQYFLLLENSQAQCKYLFCCFGDNNCVITVILFYYYYYH